MLSTTLAALRQQIVFRSNQEFGVVEYCGRLKDGPPTQFWDEYKIFVHTCNLEVVTLALGEMTRCSTSPTKMSIGAVGTMGINVVTYKVAVSGPAAVQQLLKRFTQQLTEAIHHVMNGFRDLEAATEQCYTCKHKRVEHTHDACMHEDCECQKFVIRFVRRAKT